jgi:hypothetical protein
MGLEKPGDDQARFRLAKSCPNTGARPATERYICKWGMLTAVGEALRFEILGGFPGVRVAVGQVDRVYQPFSHRHILPSEVNTFRNAAVTEMDRWVQPQALLNDLIQ